MHRSVQLYNHQPSRRTNQPHISEELSLKKGSLSFWFALPRRRKKKRPVLVSAVAPFGARPESTIKTGRERLPQLAARQAFPFPRPILIATAATVVCHALTIEATLPLHSCPQARALFVAEPINNIFSLEKYDYGDAARGERPEKERERGGEKGFFLLSSSLGQQESPN